ncbi:MAG TPA: GNAT family N-acetyltransferase [Spirochaetota bacterium]|nr:GNAT family N-acetyltransferase [Spirochaetota bacterium]
MKNVNNIKVLFYHSTKEFDEKEWDLIVDENSVLNSYGYQSAIELSNINNFKYGYFLFYKENELIAHVSTGILEFDLDMMAGQIIKNITKIIRKIFPNFMKMKVIECGHPTALGNTIVLKSKEYRDDVLEILNDSLKSLARKEKTSLIGIRDFYTNELNDYNKLKKLGYKIFQNMPNTFIKINYKNFDEYLLDLTSKRRYEIKKHLIDFYNGECVVEKITDFTEISDKLYELWYNTYKHSKEYQREFLNKEYFYNISKNLNDKSFVIIAKHNEEIIGFTMLIDSGSTLISTYCGLDYQYNKIFNTYFVLFYKSIEEAINLNKDLLELGITNYNPKIEIGAIPEPTFVYGKSTNFITNLYFVPLMRIFNTPPDFNKRSIFNKRHFERYDVKNRIFASDGNNNFLIKDISLNGIGVESESVIKVGTNLKLELKIPNEFSILIKVKVKNVFKEDQRYKIGLIIKKVNREYYLHFQNLVQIYDSFS